MRPRLTTIFLAAAVLADVASAQTSAPATAPAPVAFTPAETGPGPAMRNDATYQWSLPMPSPQVERRAYLWVPPDCRRVRGVVVGLQNMLEKLMFQDGDFRDACAASNLAILYVAPGSVSIHNDDPALSLLFRNPKEGSQQLHQLLADFAKESGYGEIAFAPLITVGHSAATPFVWGYTHLNPERVIASIPYKGWIPGGAGKGVPVLYVTSEWAEVGGPKWGFAWQHDVAGISRLREKEDALIGVYAEIGNGHYAWQPASGKMLGLFIRKAVAARVQDDAPKDGAVSLKSVPIESGVLVDPAGLGRPTFKAYPYNDYPGEKKSALWYMDEEMARTINDSMAQRLAKKPQVIDFLVNGKPAPLEKAGVAEVGPKLLSDGVTWKVQACFLDRAPAQLQSVFGAAPLGHADGPVYFRTGSGALKQVGPDTFRVWLGRGSIERQGPPWDPWVIATQPGDDRYRSADRPIHFWIDIHRKDGAPQTIDFPAIGNVAKGAGSIKLAATASSGLPVQYFVVSGPADVADDGTVTLLPIPPASKFPVRVRIGAYQWGRGIDPKVASAEPVYQEFSVEDSTAR